MPSSQGRAFRGRQRAGHEQVQLQEVAAVERQLCRLSRGDHGANGRGVGLHHREFAGHDDLLAHLSEIEREVGALLLVHLQCDRLAHGAFEPLHLHADAIRAGRQKRHVVVALAVGRCRPLLAGVDVGDGDGRTGQYAPIRVGEGAERGGRECLAVRDGRAETNREQRRENRDVQLHLDLRVRMLWPSRQPRAPNDAEITLSPSSASLHRGAGAACANRSSTRTRG